MGNSTGGSLTIYLAGPMESTTLSALDEWRQLAIRKLRDWKPGMRIINPVDLSVFGDPDHPLYADKAVLQRDLQHVQQSTLVLANLQTANKVSIGTVMEIAWAYQAQIPVIAIADPKYHDHCMIRGASIAIVEDLASALDLIETMYRDY